MKIENIGFIGGDMRMIHLIEMYIQQGITVRILGFDKFNFKDFNENLIFCEDLYSLISNSDIIIGPIPFTSNYEYINAPFSLNSIKVEDVVNEIPSNKLLICGRVDSRLQDVFNENNIKFIDILSREEFAILNAISTAEGAIQIAMEETSSTLHNTNVLVLGFGRIGKILCKMLNGLGAKVYCEARKYSDIAWIKAYGYTPILLKNLDEYISNMDLFINTIPHIVFEKERIDKMKKDCLFIDLASKPGGINLEDAKDKGLKTVLALSLPGKVAPYTAAKHIKETIDNILDEF